ncbi:MAG TPA: ABC transporter permease [Anaeromyxobacter sp.]|nr:ABC transporter permease [Anaeromyxobacter sp.]
MAKDFTLFSHATRNLRRRPARAAILVVAIGLLVSVLVFGLSFVRRVESSIRATSERLGADLIVVPTGSRGAAEDVLIEHRVKTFYMDGSILDRVRRTPGIERVTAQTYLATIGGKCCDVAESIVVAFDPDTDFVVRPWLEKKLNRRLQRGEAVVGAESAFNIRLGLMDVDGVLFGNVFHIVGVLEKTGTGLDTAIFVDEKSLDDILRGGKVSVAPGSISVVFAKVTPGVDPKRVADTLEDTIIETDTVARRDVGKNVAQALSDIARMFLATFAVASLLAALLAWAVFSGVANERSREIGLMRAIGARESHVARLFLLEVVLIGAAGSALGMLAGTALSVLLARGFSLLANVSTELSALDRVGIGAAGLLAGTAICVVGALSPIRRTRRIEPLVVLKGE